MFSKWGSFSHSKKQNIQKKKPACVTYVMGTQRLDTFQKKKYIYNNMCVISISAALNELQSMKPAAICLCLTRTFYLSLALTFSFFFLFFLDLLPDTKLMMRLPCINPVCVLVRVHKCALWVLSWGKILEVSPLPLKSCWIIHYAPVSAH